MIYFDPSEYVRGLQQLVISDKKKIGFLCGAGTSLANIHANILEQYSDLCIHFRTWATYAR